MKIKPIKKATLSEYVVDQLKTLIIKREIKVGDKLPNERELSQLFDVSRSSVREALITLESQGLLNRGNNGTYVTADFSEIIEESLKLQILLSDAKYEDIQRTRVMLERELIQLATTKRTEEHLKNLKECIEQMDKAIELEDKDLFIEADIAFHNEIAVAADNSVLLFLYNTISHLIFKIQTTVAYAYDENVVNVSQNFHKAIYQALVDKDLEMAKKQLVDHLNDVENRINKLNEMEKIAREQLQNLE